MDTRADLISKIHDFRISELRQFLRFGGATGYSTLRKDDLMVMAVALFRQNIDDCEYRVKVVELYKIRCHEPYTVDAIRAEILTAMTAGNVAASPGPVAGSPEGAVYDPAPMTPTTSDLEEGDIDEMSADTSSTTSEITSAARAVCQSSTTEVPSTSATSFRPVLDDFVLDSGVSLEKNISILMIDDGAEESSASDDSLDIGDGVPGTSTGARNSADTCDSESRRRLRAIVAHPDAVAHNLPDRTVHRTWPTYLGRQIKDLPTLQFQSHLIGPKAMNFFGGSYFCTTNVLLFDHVKQQLREDGYDVIIRFLNPKAMSDEVPYRGANVDPNLALNIFHNNSNLGRVVISNIGSQDYPIRMKRFLIDHARFNSVAFSFQVTVTGEYCAYYKKDALIMAISLVKEIPTELLFEELLTYSILPADKSLDMIHKKFTPESDEDVAVTRLEVSLKCPLSCRRIEVPAKGADCDHIDCFDCSTYLQLHVCSQAWVCPICRKVAPYDRLVVDKFMSKVLLDAVFSISDIRLYADGTWKSATDRKSLAPAVHTKKANLVLTDCIDIGSGSLNETICLDDTVDEDGGKKDNSDTFANLGRSNFITPATMLEGNGAVLTNPPCPIAARPITSFARSRTPLQSLQINSSTATGSQPTVVSCSESSTGPSIPTANPNCGQQSHFGGIVMGGLVNSNDRMRRDGGGNFANFRPTNELGRVRPSGRSPLYLNRPQSRETTLGVMNVSSNNNNNCWSTTVTCGLGGAGNAPRANLSIYRNSSYNNNNNSNNNNNNNNNAVGFNNNRNYGHYNNQNFVSSTLVQHYRGGNNRPRAGWGGYMWENNSGRNGALENFNPVSSNRIPNFW